MGCDIHLYVEAKPLEQDRWIRIDRQISFHEGWDDREKQVITLDWGDGRNYNAFAMLADVRNGSGFAGVDTGDGFEPIAMPRGLPEDASPSVYDESERWGVDGHSHSYFTLRELLNLETLGYWDKTTTIRGVFTTPELEKAKAEGIVESVEGQEVRLTKAPQSWSGGIWGPDLKDIFHISWEQSYRTSAGWLINDTIPLMRELASNYSLSRGVFTKGLGRGKHPYPVVFPSEGEILDHWTDAAELVRIVFWFDN
jgi:hypothetical protein